MTARITTPDGTVYSGKVLSGERNKKGKIVLMFEIKERSKDGKQIMQGMQV